MTEEKVDPLADIEQIVEQRPELTQEEWEVVDKAIPWLKATLKPQIRKELEVFYTQENEKFQEEIKAINQSYINQKLDEIKKAQEPLAKDELEKLLSQEYIQFEVKVRVDGTIRVFTIMELPSTIEEKFLNMLKKHFVPILRSSQNVKFKLDGSLVEKIQVILDSSTKTLRVAAETAALVLDPWEQDKTINAEWVLRNLSISRIVAVLLAQFEANKYRDFFFQGFLRFQSLTTGQMS